MISKFKVAIKETLELIDQRKFELGCEEVIHVNDMFDGVLIQCFSGWKKYKDVAKEKGFNVNESELYDINLYFIPENGIINCIDNDHRKTIICLEGELEIRYKDTVKLLYSLSVLDIMKNMYHSVIAHTDTFVILIEH